MIFYRSQTRSSAEEFYLNALTMKERGKIIFILLEFLYKFL